MTTRVYNVPLSEIVGKTCIKIDKADGNEWSEHFFRFEFDDGSIYELVHHQNCCESVSLEDMEGDIEWLIGNPILVAEAPSSDDDRGSKVETYTRPDGTVSSWTDESYTWTYYKFATIRGNVDMRFYGSSNGYYSEDVDFDRVRGPNV